MALASLADIIDVMPQLLFMAQLAMNLVLAWAFGAIAFRGLKKQAPFYIKIPAMLGTGFLCLMAGASLREYMFFFQGTVFRLIQIDLFIGGVISAIIVAVSLYLITRKKGEGPEGKILKKLQERVRLLEGLLLREKVPTLKEYEVRKTAEALVPGFAAKQASLRNTDWEILLEKGDKRATVLLDAYTGEVRKIEHFGTKDPYMIVGIAIIIMVAVFAVLSFRGVPSFAEGVASLFGMSEEQFNALLGGKEMPVGCVQTVRILMKHGVSVVGSGENSYSDEGVMNMIENETGRQVVLMYKADYGGKEYVVSITLPMDFNTSSGFSNEDLMQNAEICTSTSEVLCDCIKIPELSNMMTGFIVAVDGSKK
jgi:hypothetical protein